MEVLPLKFFLLHNLEITIRDDNMALLKYFKIEKRGPPLPDPSGSLNQH